MKLETALDEYSLLLRRRHRGDDGRRTVTGLAALREYLMDYSGYDDTESVEPRDLFHFLLDYYPSQEEPDAEVAVALLEVTAGFAQWLVERGQRSLASVAAAEERLREDLPRVLSAYTVLRDHARRDDLSSTIELADEESGVELGTMEGGVNRTAHLDRIDYAAAEEEYFTVRSAGGGVLALQSAEREALGEVPAAPVLVPPAALELLRPGDIIHAEIAPGPAGWEILEVFGIRPGEYP